MSDSPTHIVIIETHEGKELRRFGPMHQGRALTVKAKMENTSVNVLTERVRIMDSPNWDFEHNREKEDVDSNKKDRRDIDDR